MWVDESEEPHGLPALVFHLSVTSHQLYDLGQDMTSLWASVSSTIKRELDKMCSEASSRWDIPSHYYVPLQKREGQLRGSVARLVGVSEGQRGEGWELFLPQNLSLSLSSERLPWLLPGHCAALQHRVQCGFPGPVAGLPPQARSAESLFPFPSPSGPRFFPFPPAPLCSRQDSEGSPGTGGLCEGVEVM